MFKICSIAIILIELTFGLPTIIFPSDLEDEQRYKVIEFQPKINSAPKAIIFPKDDYDDDIVDEIHDNNNLFKDFKHNAKYHQNLLNERSLPAVDNDINTTNITLENRFLFRTVRNCKCKFNGRCAKIQDC
ncbi:hypothetical protein FF38_03079 [Lucilia cuprina]|uniref:Uncharacterized protein n=1 Tax=Lucilia cuprina TaxID=7375 RepID=A0A0L0CJE5_LUCCU|nr:hypothetical protein CVS40_3238 [Lucilia cuprina]KNC25803.1 hypothetical protein FF38_05458 [Lucilia cuprina]KNC32528.1 hypothetical protein FF38_03079 [Lucilia cuprina]